METNHNGKCSFAKYELINIPLILGAFLISKPRERSSLKFNVNKQIEFELFIFESQCLKSNTHNEASAKSQYKRPKILMVRHSHVLAPILITHF